MTPPGLSRMMWGRDHEASQDARYYAAHVKEESISSNLRVW